MSHTKILATIGPASDDITTIEAMLRAGASAFRLNFSHGDEAGHRAAVAAIRAAARRSGAQTAILGDLPGPKIRLGPIPEGPIFLEEGRPYFLTHRAIPGGPEGATVRYARLLQDIGPGDHVALNDGAVLLRVISVAADRLACVVESGGEIASNKGVNFPGARLGVPGLTPADRRWIRFAIAERFDLLALSFVRSPEDLRLARRAIRAAGGDIPLIAKIEKHEAVEEMEAIIAEADGAMAARGDLGVEVAIERTPLIQKRLIRLCNRAAKPVITATQMLESMTVSRRPTRAEVSDVANAILDGTDTVMLSAETAIGRHPVEAVAVMERVARAAEPGLRDIAWFREPVAPSASSARSGPSTDAAIAHAAVRIAETIGADAILCCTSSGATARRVARHRPAAPLVAVSQNCETVERLQLTWGVCALCLPPHGAARRHADVEAVMDASAKAAMGAGLLRSGQTIVATAGAPLYTSGNTNLIRVIAL